MDYADKQHRIALKTLANEGFEDSRRELEARRWYERYESSAINH
jgi:hypothetical protein